MLNQRQLSIQKDDELQQYLNMKINRSSHQRNVNKYPPTSQSQNKNRVSQAASPLPSIRKTEKLSDFICQFPLQQGRNRSNQNSPIRIVNKRSSSSQSNEYNGYQNQQQQQLQLLNQGQQQQQIMQNIDMNRLNATKRIKKLLENSLGNQSNEQDSITQGMFSTNNGSNRMNQSSAQKYKNGSQSTQHNSQINFFKDTSLPISQTVAVSQYPQSNYQKSSQGIALYNQKRNSQQAIIHKNQYINYNTYLNEFYSEENKQDDNLIFAQPEINKQEQIVQEKSKESLLDPELFVTNEVLTETKSQMTNESIKQNKNDMNENKQENQKTVQISQKQNITNNKNEISKQKSNCLIEISANQIVEPIITVQNQKGIPSSTRLNSHISNIDEQIPQNEQNKEQKIFFNQLGNNPSIALNSITNRKKSKQYQPKQPCTYIDFIQNIQPEKEQQSNIQNIKYQSSNQKGMNSNYQKSLQNVENINYFQRSMKKYKVERRSSNSNYNNLSDYIENSNIQTLQDTTPQQFEEISCSMPIQTAKKSKPPNNYLSITQQSINSDSVMKMGLTPSGILSNGRLSVNSKTNQRQCQSVNRAQARNSSLNSRFPSRAGSPQNHSFSSNHQSSNTEKTFQKMFRRQTYILNQQQIQTYFNQTNRRNFEHASSIGNTQFVENNESTAESLNVQLFQIFKSYNNQEINKIIIDKKSLERYLQNFDPENDENSRIMQDSIIEYFTKWSQKIEDSIINLKDQLEKFWSENEDLSKKQLLLKRMPQKTQKYNDDCQELCGSSEMFLKRTNHKELVEQVLQKCTNSLYLINLLNTIPRVYQSIEDFFIQSETNLTFSQLIDQNLILIANMRGSIFSDQFLCKFQFNS